MVATWTDDHIATLRALWAADLTAGEISRQLGDMSRNAVIGKARRLNLEARCRRWIPVNGKVRLPRIFAPPIFVAPPKPAEPVTFDQLRRHHCRFPLWNEPTDAKLYCGGDKLEGSSYCQHHHRIAYQPARERRAA